MLKRLGLTAAAIMMAALAMVLPAAAQSAGCLALSAEWGSGISRTNLNDHWTQYTLAVGEVITYSATSSGSTNAANDPYSGAGFAIYEGSGQQTIIFETYATAGNELALSGNHPAGSTDVTLYLWGGGANGTATATATCAAPPSVSGISPTNGPTAGGTVVTITGTGFTGASGVTFGGSAASFTVNSSTQITATAPVRAAGTVDVRVTTAGGTSANTASDNFTYVAAPTVTSVTPTGGPTGGGTSVTITGTNFSGATAVAFGGTAANGFTVNSATQITATSPAGTGTIDVRVTTVGGTSATSAADQFTYVAAPTVTAVSPTAGPTSGGTTVIITGTGFSSASAVTFGATAATGFSVNSASQITATSPAGSAGSVDIRVTNTGGTSATGAADVFTYIAQPTVTSVSPASGASAGGTAVTIVGTNFTGASAVTFGATAATGFTVNSGTSITATSPSGAGTVDVRVTNAGGTSATSAADQYTYFTVPAAPTIGTATAGDGGASVTFTANSDGGTAVTNFTVTANPGGATGAGSSSPIVVSGLTNGTAYTFTVVATNSEGDSTASAASNSATPKANQTITFNNPGTQNFGTAPTLTATASSSLAVTFTSSTTGVCTIGSTTGELTFVTGGTCTIDADQAGSSSVNAASTVSQSFTVAAVVPGAPSGVSATAGTGQADVTFTAPASNGGGAISYYTATANPGGATGTVAGPGAATITVAGLTDGVPYTFTVTATNSAGTGSASAPSNTATPRAAQIITFADPGAQLFGAPPTLSASASSGLTPTFTSATPGICTISSSSQLTFVATGVCTINADQAGDSTYLPAPQVQHSFLVMAVQPSAPSDATATAGDTMASITFTAPASNGGAAISYYTVTSSPDGLTGTGASSPIIVMGLTNGLDYTFTVTANNMVGNSPSSAPSNTVTPKATQTITFSNPGPQTFGTTPTLSATADSGLNPTFSSSTQAICTITPLGQLAFLGAGSCTITASQPGNGSYLAGLPVTWSFTVNAATPGAPAIGLATAGNADASVAFTAPANTGGTTISLYTATSNPGGFTATGTSSPIVVPGLSNGTAYTFTVTADTSAGTGPASAASNSVTPQATQTITFTNPGPQAFGTTPTLTASASSGLPVVFSSSTAPVCTITTGGVLTPVSAGTCTISVDQAGDGANLPALQVTQSFAIDAILAGPPTGVSAVASGTTSAVVSFTAPVATGGGAITGFTVTANPGGITATGAASPITASGLPAGTSYTFTVTANNPAGPGPASAPSSALAMGQAQTIDFINPGAKTLGTSPVLTATATSGLPVAFMSTTPAICTITAGGNLSTVALGTCTIEARQPGDGVYGPAPVVSQSFAIANSAVTVTPATGALADAMAAEGYSAKLTATGQSGIVIWALASGTMPAGLVLNISTGELTGPIDAAAAGAYSFAISATDQAGGGVGVANLTLNVLARAVTVTPKVVTVPAGSTPPNVDLVQGATGGPFASAAMVGVSPPHAGTASIVSGEFASITTNYPSSFYLKFIPNPQYTGPVVVSFTLQSVLGTSNVSTVTFNTVVNPVVVEQEFEKMVTGFVTARGNLLANGVEAPGLRDRRSDANASMPGTVSVTPSGDSVTLNFASSGLQMAAFEATDSLIAEPMDDGGLNFWIDGTATLHMRPGTAGGNWGSFALLSMGVDMLATDTLMLGVALHGDWMEDLNATDRITGRGLLVGPYISAELGKGVFLDASLFYGRSWNDVTSSIFGGTFGTERLLGKARLEGEWTLSDTLSLRPSANLFYLRESVESYVIDDGMGTTALVNGFVIEQIRLSAGGSLHYLLEMDNGLTVRPFVGLNLGWSLTNGQSGSFATLSGGVDLSGLGQWTLGLSGDAELGSDGFKSISAKARLGVNF